MGEHSTPIQNIWLIREARSGFEYAVVYVQRNGIWYEAIQELIEGQFSHCISSYGLVDDLYCKPVSWLNEKQEAIQHNLETPNA